MADPPATPAGRRRARVIALAAGSAVAEVAALRARGYRRPGNVIVRCRDGHLFTTIWLPVASIKSLRLGLWRFQRCPVGRHWSVVRPVNPAKLTPAELESAREHRDIRLP